MAIKIKIKNKRALKESTENIEEIFGLGSDRDRGQATTQTMARRGMSDEMRDEISDMLKAHDPGSSEHNNKKNPYNIPEGEPPIDATFLVDLYTRLTVKGDKLRIQSADRTMGTLGLYMKRAAAAESEQDAFSAINRAKLYLDDLYRRLLAMGVDPGDPSTHEPCPRGQKRVDGECVDKERGDPGEDAVIECDEENGFEWDASKGKCVKKETGEVEDPKCPDGQTWDAEAGKCVDGGEETPPPEGEDKPAVPIYKFPKEKGADGKRLQPLSSKLAKAGLNKATINTILRSIAKQLKSNNVEITEGLLKEATSMVLERLSLTERDTTGKYTGGVDTSKVEPMETDTESGEEDVEYEYKFNMPKFKTNKEYKNIRSRWNKAIEKAGEEASDRLFIKHTNEFAEFIGPFYPPKLFKEGARDEIEKVTNVDRLRGNKKDIIAAFKRLKKTNTGEHGAKVIILKAIGDNRKKISLRINAMLNSIERSAVEGEEEKPEEKGPPKSWVTEGGTQEEWDALPNKEKFVFLKMDKKRKFFKMSSEERLELYGKMKKGGDTKASTGAEETAAAQAAAGEKAAEKGFGDKAYKQGDGKIRISTLNQQLKTIDPQADQGERKKALNLVQKHLKPYLKINNLKLSESEIRDFTNQIVEVILKSSR